jgi:hypothetical protein
MTSFLTFFPFPVTQQLVIPALFINSISFSDIPVSIQVGTDDRSFGCCTLCHIYIMSDVGRLCQHLNFPAPRVPVERSPDCETIVDI